jgi:hypothetical protein
MSHKLQSGLAALLLCAAMALPALGEDDIMSKAVNDPSVGWAASGSGAKVELYKDPTVTGGTAERMTISGKSTNPWDWGGQIAVIKPLAQGDVLLLAFWAKAETAPPGATTIDVNTNIQNNSAPYQSLGSGYLHIGPQWKMYFVVATADKDYKKNEVGVQLQLATAAQVIDLGPLFILDYGVGYDKTKLPHS